MAADTKISLHYLECLEAGRYNELPGGMYNRAFLRAYCDKLNLNQQEILNRYESEISPPFDKVPKTKVHIHQKDTNLKLSPVVIWTCMLLISATGLFFSRKWIAEVFSPYFSRKPIVTATDIAKPTTPPSSTESPPLPVQAAASQGTVETPTAGSIDRDIPPASDEPTTVPAQTQPETDMAPGTIQAPLRLEIGVTEKCWVSVDRDGSPAIRRLMGAGEVQTINAKEQFLLILGNAGGAHLKINGKPTKPLGRSGEVVKILINENNLQDLLESTSG